MEVLKSQYKSLAEWRKADPTAYDAAYRQQILHMVAANYGWTYNYSGYGYNNNFLPFEEAKAFVHSLKLKGQKEWDVYCKSGKRPNNIPRVPSKTYKNTGYVSWGDWFGTTFLSFKEARKYVHSLQLNNQKEWREYCRSGNKPDNIPSSPDNSYKNNGWLSYGDWLGVKIGFNGYLSFEESRKFVCKLNLKTQRDWKVYCKSGTKPDNIPNAPQSVYKNDGWLSIGDWLSTKIGFNGYLPFEEARAFVHSLNLMSQLYWFNYCKSDKKPNYIPSHPHKTYKNTGYVNWGDWLGTNTIATQNRIYLPFKEAREFVHKLKIINNKEWLSYCKSGKKPNDIPSHPHKTYKNNGWSGIPDWLDNKTKKTFLTFEEARAFVHSLKLKGYKEWREYCNSGNKPSNIPYAPEKNYKNNGWSGIPDWLGK